jgi:glycosyltransferase involved in cell wall biosynthesis
MKVPRGTEVAIINSDNPFAPEIMDSNKDVKFIMYKLSHNERFKDIESSNLNLPWDHIMTTTDWLREACLNVQEGWEHNEWDEDKVTTVGWYHYGHPMFQLDPKDKVYGDIQSGIAIGTLIHAHPLKGTEESLSIIRALKKKYEANISVVGLGESRVRGLPWYVKYFQSLNRPEFSQVLKQLDIWLGASHTEGLGRLSLEAMSAGVAVVTTDTGAEFLKHEENCLLYPVGDAQAGGEAVDRLINDLDLFNKIVVNGYETAWKSADYKPFQAKLNEIIKKVVEND